MKKCLNSGLNSHCEVCADESRLSAHFIQLGICAGQSVSAEGQIKSCQPRRLRLDAQLCFRCFFSTLAAVCWILAASSSYNDWNNCNSRHVCWFCYSSVCDSGRNNDVISTSSFGALQVLHSLFGELFVPRSSALFSHGFILVSTNIMNHQPQCGCGLCCGLFGHTHTHTHTLIVQHIHTCSHVYTQT